MMEKGSILPSQKSTPPVHAQQTDEKVKNIPLPTQMPKGVDFSEIPMSALKSATLEGLISQNEDLMARLSVSLRKINELEDSVTHAEREKKNFHTRFQTLREQFLILQEKDKNTTHRTLQQHEENVTLRNQGGRIEKLYADLYGQAQALQVRLVRLERYRARVRKVAPDMQKKAKTIKILENEIVQYRQSLQAQTRALTEEFQNKIADYEAKLEASRHEIADVKKDLQTQHMQSINSFELKLSEAEQENLAFKSKAAERDQLYEDLLKSENARIFEQRQMEQARAETSAIVARLELETVGLRIEVKELLVDREAKTQELIRLTAELPNLRERNQNMVEQVESLQALWNHKQRELEQAEEKNKSLQKLNQSISLTLNQQRKEIHQLQVELDKERFSAQEKVKTLVTEIQILRTQIPGIEGGGPEKL